MSGLSPAERFLLCTINGDNGRPRLDPDARDRGIAAALLGQLVLTGHITIVDAHVELVEVGVGQHPLRPAQPPLVGAAFKAHNLLLDMPVRLRGVAASRALGAGDAPSTYHPNAHRITGRGDQ